MDTYHQADGVQVARHGHMKTMEDIRGLLAKQKLTLKKRFKVGRIGIFGSFVRGEENTSSDIDILVELEEPIGWEFVDLKDFLEESLEMSVDLVTVKALKPQLRDAILREVVYA